MTLTLTLTLLQALAALKEKSPALFEKAEKLHKMLKEKIDALGEEAKAFAKEVSDTLTLSRP